MPNFSMETEHVIAWCILDFIFSLKRQHYEMSSGAVMRMEACLASASQIVDRLEILSRQGVLAILQDTVSCMTSALGIFLHKVSSPDLHISIPNFITLRPWKLTCRSSGHAPSSKNPISPTSSNVS